jgi:hypothetical protein
VKLHPLDWNFSSCPPNELPILYCYELSRESIALREAVDYMRHGRPMGPTYWSNIPVFGWREWPEYPFLSIPATERQKRLTQLLVPNPVADIVGALAEHPPSSSLWEQQLAIAAHVREKCTAKHGAPPKGRRANALNDQLRALSIYRLLQHHSAREARRLIRENFRNETYNDLSNLNRAKRRVPEHLAAFVLRAQEKMRQGQWFAPFGPFVLNP